MKLFDVAAAAFLLASALPIAAGAQERQSDAECLPGSPVRQPPSRAAELPQERGDSAERADVVLNVPHLSVEKLRVEVDTLDAHLSLDGSVANLVRINAGLEVHAKDVRVLLCGVQTDVDLRVRLDNIARIITRALQSLDKNPGLLRELDAGSADQTSGASPPP
jgi:hypothetical protein